VFRFAPSEADVENARDVDRDVDGRIVEVDDGSPSRGRGADGWRERRENEVVSVEKVDDCAVRLGMRRTDLGFVTSTKAKLHGR
jgi:hypothetical protein